MRVLLFLLFFSTVGFAQNYKYVNTDSLRLFEYPDTSSQVYIYLHPPTKIEVEEITDERYAPYPQIINEWYILRFFINNGMRHGGITYKGYIRKKDLVEDVKSVTARVEDPEVLFSYSLPNDTTRHDLKFYRSSKGGCYYINAAGKKEYVNFCRE